jgi:hypothetical protein
MSLRIEFKSVTSCAAVRLVGVCIGVPAASQPVEAGALWTVYEGDFTAWSAAVNTSHSYSFAGTGLPYWSQIGDLYSGDGITMESCVGMSDAGPSANVFLDASAASDPDGFAALVWNWGFSLLRFRFETPIRAIWLETGGWSQSTGAWSDDGSISGFVNDSTYLNLGLVFEVPVSTVVVSTQWMQDFHVEFVPAPGVIPFMVFGAAGLPLRRRR